MDKLDFVISNKETATFKFQKQDIEVIPYIPQSAMLEIAKNFVDISIADFDGVVECYLSAHWAMIMGVLRECTNVKVNEENFDSIISSGLWDEIKLRIENYEDFVTSLGKMLQRELENMALEKGLGQSLDKITNGILGFLNKIGELDLSQDGINNLVGKLGAVVKETEEKFPGATSVVKTRKKRVSKKTE